MCVFLHQYKRFMHRVKRKYSAYALNVLQAPVTSAKPEKKSTRAAEAKHPIKIAKKEVRLIVLDCDGAQPNKAGKGPAVSKHPKGVCSLF